MLHTIENAFLTVEVNSLGAELFSLRTKNPRREYLWQGLEAVWPGRSPVLFPVIGRLLEDTYYDNGKAYSLQKHGFARKKEFQLIENSGDSLGLSLQNDAETRAVYPFGFELQLRFSLEGNALYVTHTVLNRSDRELPFSLGAHPGFQCETGDYLEFELPETVSTERIHTGDAYLLEERFPLLANETRLPITKELFEPDALILSGLRSSRVTLKSERHPHTVDFFFGNAPFLGIWAKPGASYVCIEPWFGVNDSYTRKSDIREKRGIEVLPVGESFEYTFTVKVH